MQLVIVVSSVGDERQLKIQKETNYSFPKVFPFDLTLLDEHYLAETGEQCTRGGGASAVLSA